MSRLDKFNACPDCLYWKIRKFLKSRTNALDNFMKYEIMYSLEEKILQELSDGSKTIPQLCRSIPEATNEFKMMRAIANLQRSNDVELETFERVYREDGGAINLAKYCIKTQGVD